MDDRIDYQHPLRRAADFLSYIAFHCVPYGTDIGCELDRRLDAWLEECHGEYRQDVLIGVWPEPPTPEALRRLTANARYVARCLLLLGREIEVAPAEATKRYDRISPGPLASKPGFPHHYFVHKFLNELRWRPQKYVQLYTMLDEGNKWILLWHIESLARSGEFSRLEQLFYPPVALMAPLRQFSWVQA